MGIIWPLIFWCGGGRTLSGWSISLRRAIFERTFPFSGSVSESWIVFRPSKSKKSSTSASLSSLLLKSKVLGPRLCWSGLEFVLWLATETSSFLPAPSTWSPLFGTKLYPTVVWETVLAFNVLGIISVVAKNVGDVGDMAGDTLDKGASCKTTESASPSEYPFDICPVLTLPFHELFCEYGGGLIGTRVCVAPKEGPLLWLYLTALIPFGSSGSPIKPLLL